MKYGSTEYKFARSIATGLAEFPDFRRWILCRTEFADSADARLLHAEMSVWRGNPCAEWWRFHFTEKCRCAGCCGKETDILAIFEGSSQQRFALHFEVKQPRDRFKKDGVQSIGYPLRAQCWVATPPANVLPHQAASTALFFSESRGVDYAAHPPHFRTLITWEEIGSAFPDRAKAWA